jgi:hypothetical protein
MATDHGNFRLPLEDSNNLALLPSWNAWSLRRKRSKQSLLDDLIGIDPVIQKHMTIAATSSATLETKKEVVLQHHQCQQHDFDNAEHCIPKQESHVDFHRMTKHRLPPFQDQLNRVAKLRRLNYTKSKKLASYRSNGHNNSNDTQYTFWRNLNALTGNIHGKTFDLTH